MEQLISIYKFLIHLPRWKKWLIILVLGTIFYIFLYYHRVQPLKEKLTENQRRINSLILTVNRLKVLEKRERKLRTEIASLKKQIKNLENKLPTGRENVAQIIDSITKADSGVIIEKILRKSKVNSKYYIKYPYELRLIGNYPSFVSWCEKLSKANRIINFGSMEINSLKEREKNTIKTATISIKLNLEAFTLKE